MSSQDNTRVVQDAYAAFGRGDIASLIALMSPDVDWESVIGVASNVPMRGRRSGPAAVTNFFAQVAENVEFHQFEPREFVADRDKVVVLGYYRGTARKTGRGFESDWVMVFTVRDGKVTRFREYMDAGAVNAAFAGL